MQAQQKRAAARTYNTNASTYDRALQRPPANYSATSSSGRSEAPSSQVSNVTSNTPERAAVTERLVEPRRSFTVQAAMQEIAQPDGLANAGSDSTANQGEYSHCLV